MSWVGCSVLLAVAAGCSQPAATSSAAGQGNQGQGNLVGHVARAKDKVKIENDLRQLALLYRTYTGEMARPPRDWKEFREYIEKDARPLARAVDEGRYVVRWNQSLSSNGVIAYEKEPDLDGKQLAAMGDASVRPFTAKELEEALRAGR